VTPPAKNLHVLTGFVAVGFVMLVVDLKVPPIYAPRVTS